LKFIIEGTDISEVFGQFHTSGLRFAVAFPISKLSTGTLMGLAIAKLNTANIIKNFLSIIYFPQIL